VSLALGVLQLGNSSLSRALWPTYLHLLVFGWLTQLIFGVALWLFPRDSRSPLRSGSLLGWVCYSLLNVGLWLRAVGEPARMTGYDTGWVLAVSAVLQSAAGWIFVLTIWPRVKER
jgi:hypothetical protein